MERTLCYFAHPITDYDTTREAISLAVLANSGFDVMNPNSQWDQEQYLKRGMNHFLDRVAQCGAVAFQRFPDGEIGAGVGKEILHGQGLELPIYEVSGLELIEVDAIAVADDVLSVEATKNLLSQLDPVRFPVAEEIA